jgi:PAS domain S-box-containing protein
MVIHEQQGALATPVEYSAQQRLDAARVRQLYALAPTGLIITLAVALATVMVLWSNTSYGELSLWLLATTLVTAGRFLLYRRFVAQPREPDVAPMWENRFALGAAAAGAAWGTLVGTVQPADVTYELLFVLISLGMAASAAGLLAPSHRSLAAFIVPLAVGQIAKVLLVGDPVHLAMAAFGLIYLLFLWRIAFDYHRMLLDTVRRHIKDDDLLREQQRIFNSSAVGIALVHDRTIGKCNARLAELLGYSIDEMSSRPTRALYGDDETWAARSREVAAAVARREICQFEERLVRKGGARFWCLVQGQAASPAGPEIDTVLTFSEIGSLKSVEATLRESRDQYELVIRASQGGVWDWDIAGKRCYFSPQFKAILGYPPDADFTTLFFFADALHPEDRDRMVAAQAAHLKEREPFDHEYRLRTSEGGYIWVHGRGQAIWDDSGRATRFAGSIIDISARRRI